MSDFFQYLRVMVIAFFTNFGTFFKKTFADPWADIPSQFAHYANIFAAYVDDFGFWGWFFFVLFFIFLFVFLFAFFYLIFRLLRRYLIFRNVQVDKAKLIDQIQKLNYELFSAVTERNKMFGVRAASLGIDFPEEEKEEKKSEEDFSRFPKLLSVDKKYGENEHQLVTPSSDIIPLDELVARFRSFAASQLGLYYDLFTLRCLFAGMGSTKIIILEGISGTGKTSLPYALGKYLQNDAIICSVQPSWRDRSELIGYFNEFTKKFNESDFLKGIYESTYRQDNNIIILDELNLARIEYYFAEFLSIMEMPNVEEWKIELINNPDPLHDPKHLKNGKLLIPQNLWFIGTANNDDSTFTITDKVYDRAISINFEYLGEPFDTEFKESISITHEYLKELFTTSINNYPMTSKLLEKFNKLDQIVFDKFKLSFGNRIVKQMKQFVPIFVGCGGNELEALDFIFESKILKKFESLNIAFLRTELKELVNELDKLFGKSAFNRSKKYINRLIRINE